MSRSRITATALALALAAFGALGGAASAQTATVPAGTPPAAPSPAASPGTGGGLSATAELRDAQGNRVGTATFSEGANAGQMRVQVQISGFTAATPGEHGIHLHAVGRCDPPDFTSAAGHFNPTNAQHGLNNPAGPHAGDLPNITIGADGSATYDQTTDRALLIPGTLSLLDADGSAIVIHAGVDDQRTDPTGNSGGRIACGVIMAQTVAQTPGAAATPTNISTIPMPTATAGGFPTAFATIVTGQPTVAPVETVVTFPTMEPTVEPPGMPRTGSGGAEMLIGVAVALGLALLALGGVARLRRSTR